MADAGRPVATLAVAARPRLRSCRRSQRVTNLLVVAAHRAAAMGGLGIACPGNRPHSDAIFGRARGSKRLGALTGVGHPTYPAIGVTLDQREATPFCGTSGTGSGSGLRAFQGAGTAGSPPQVPRDVASRVSARSRRGSLNPWSVAMGNQWLLLSRKT